MISRGSGSIRVPGYAERGTIHTELAEYLHTNGRYHVDIRLRVGALPALAIVRMVPKPVGHETHRSARARRRRGHWVLYVNGVWYDPCADGPSTTPPGGAEWRVASWLGVRSTETRRRLPCGCCGKIVYVPRDLDGVELTAYACDACAFSNGDLQTHTTTHEQITLRRQHHPGRIR